MKGKFYESDFEEAKRNFEWIQNLTTTLTHEIETPAPPGSLAPPTVVPGSQNDARLRVAVALGLAPIAILTFGREDGDEDLGLLPVDGLALRIRERLTGDSAVTNQTELQKAFDSRFSQREYLRKRYSDNPPESPSKEPQDDPKTRRGKLPDGFPGKAALEAADIRTYGEVRKHKDLTSINNIGEETAKKIRAEAGIDETLEPGARGPSQGTPNTGVADDQVVTEETPSEDDKDLT